MEQRFVANKSGLKFGDAVLDVGDPVPVGYGAHALGGMLSLGWVLPAGTNDLAVVGQPAVSIHSEGVEASASSMVASVMPEIEKRLGSRRDLIARLEVHGVEVPTNPYKSKAVLVEMLQEKEGDSAQRTEPSD